VNTGAASGHDPRHLDDPLLEFVAQVVARQLAEESGLLQEDDAGTNQ
jgi:hypothetical protein